MVDVVVLGRLTGTVLGGEGCTEALFLAGKFVLEVFVAFEGGGGIRPYEGFGVAAAAAAVDALRVHCMFRLFILLSFSVLLRDASCQM